MSDASTKQAVECPICGDEFDPTVAGGWCTNTECGEWQYTEGTDDADETTADDADETTADDADEAAADDADPAAEASVDDGFVSAADAETTDSESVGLFGDTDDEDEGSADEGDSTGVESDSGDEASGSVDDVSDAEAADGVDEGGAVDCPDCDAELDADANFCPECGVDVSGVASEDGDLDACPGCGTDVGPADNFCVSCGEDLDAHCSGDAHEDAIDALDSDDGGHPESLVLEVEGREIDVDDGDTVGREIRAALTDAGRPDDEAVRIHREHVRFVRESDRFFLLDLGDNPTLLNGQTLQKGDREPVDPGDELELSGVASVTVQAP